MGLFVLVLFNMIDPIDYVFCLVTIDGCERSVFYFGKVYEEFEGHEVGKVILLSSTN